MNPLIIPYAITGICVIIGGIIGGRYAIKNRRDAAKDSSRIPLPPTWPEMWARMDSMDKRLAAFGHILSAAAEQWPNDHPGPVFDQEDIDLLADTLPAQWIHRKAS